MPGLLTHHRFLPTEPGSRRFDDANIDSASRLYDTGDSARMIVMPCRATAFISLAERLLKRRRALNGRLSSAGAGMPLKSSRVASFIRPFSASHVGNRQMSLHHHYEEAAFYMLCAYMLIICDAHLCGGRLFIFHFKCKREDFACGVFTLPQPDSPSLSRSRPT